MNRLCRWPWLLSLFLLVGEIVLACDFQPNTELEQIYCELQDRGAAQGLPNIFEFRKNPPTTQALLLKKPAQRLGIKIPSPRKAKATAPPETTAAAPIPIIEPKRDTAVGEPVPAPPSAKNGLDDCKLNRETIVCGVERFVLQSNLQNRQLATGALEEENRLLLPSQTDLKYHDKSIQYYLSNIYPYYLEKMLEIGLGDATMSYTKFAATYDDITQRGDSFTERFAKMYELLKTERKSNAIKARYNNNFPSSISQCMRASHALLVCDDVQQNWIYRTTGNK